MEVILKQDIEKLGRVGSIVNVKPGYARNFLIPNNLALPLNTANLKKLEQEKQRKIEELDKAKKAAEGLKEKLSGFSLTIPTLSQEDDKIYGSVTTQDIEKALKDEGFDIDKDYIILTEPIKSLGIYEIPIKLHPEVSTQIKVWIVKK
jgi:large subunit ribosomal protein L9